MKIILSIGNQKIQKYLKTKIFFIKILFPLFKYGNFLNIF